MRYRRGRVRGATVDLVSDGTTLREQRVEPTAERQAKGDLETVYRRNQQGNLTRITRSVTPGLVEQLALAGELGENVPRLLAAAQWFMEQADLAQLRGRFVHSQLVNRDVFQALSPEGRVARGNLVRAYDLLGADCWAVIFDSLVWEVMPRGPDRRALFRAALHALAQALNAENPPTG